MTIICASTIFSSPLSSSPLFPDSAQDHTLSTTCSPAMALEPEGHFIMYTNAGNNINKAREVASTDLPSKDTCDDDRSMDSAAAKASYRKQHEVNEALHMKECELKSRLQQADEVITQAKLDQKEAVEATKAFRMKECELKSRLQQADEVITQAKLDQKEAVEATKALRMKECELNSRLQQANEVITQAKLDRKDVDNAMREAAAVQDAATKASSKAALDIKAAEKATEALLMKENDIRMAYEKLALDVKASEKLHHEATSAMKHMQEESEKKNAFYDEKQQDFFRQAKTIDDALWTSKQERKAADSVIKQAAADSEKAGLEVQSAQELLLTAAAVKQELGFMTSQDSTIPPQSKRRKRKKWNWININQFRFDPNKADK